MEKPSGTPSERRRISSLSSTASFARWPKIGRDLTTFFLGLVLTAGVGGFYNDLLFDLGNPNPFPCIPLAGIRWQLNDVLILNLTAPRPEIDVKVSRRITLFANGQFSGGNFRVPDSTGTAIGRPQFNNAVLTYREIRLGGGVRLKLLPFAAVQTEAGEAPGRDFDYYGIHENLKVNNAPYVDTRLMFSF